MIKHDGSLNKIFYDKEPEWHTFYLSKDRKRLYKCWHEYCKQHYDNCLLFYTKLKGCRNIPILFDTYKYGTRWVLEMEFVPWPPLFGYGKFTDVAYTASQKESIGRQLSEYIELCKREGLYKDGLLLSEFTINNICYDADNDRIVIYDFALSHVRPDGVLWEVNRILDATTHGGPSARLSEKEIKALVCPRDTKKELVGLSKSVMDGLNKLGPKYAYESVYVDGELFSGQAPYSMERFKNVNINWKDFWGKSVLDIGASNGGLCVYSIDQGAVDVLGIEAVEGSVRVGKEYLKYLTKMYSKYGNIRLVQADAVLFDYPKNHVDTILYFGCWRHFGNSPGLHKRIGGACNVIYFGGHAHEEERMVMELHLKEFGDFSWEYIGWCPESSTGEFPHRPIFRGERK